MRDRLISVVSADLRVVGDGVRAILMKMGKLWPSQNQSIRRMVVMWNNQIRPSPRIPDCRHSAALVATAAGWLA
jgi:hypothetical protein